ncbi:MAG: hypothetical protein RSE05_09770 [Clostridium sp.]
MKHVKKNFRLFLGCIACSAILSMTGASMVHAEEKAIPMTEPVFIYGQIYHENGRLSMKNIKGDATLDELLLNISEETKILDAVNGLPVPKDDLKDGEGVYAYISHAMAMSLPPQSHAFMIICKVPADFAAPSFETVDKLSQNADGSTLLTTMRGNQFTLDSTTSYLPYLTRNIVTMQDLTKGRTCLIWKTQRVAGQIEANAGTAAKVVIFPTENGGNGSNGGGKISGPASDPELIARR